MEKLIKEYNENGAIKSKLVNFIWKGGILLFTIVYFIYNKQEQNGNSIFIYMGALLILYLIAEGIFIKKALKKINYNSKINIKNIKEIYLQIKKYQKTWITNYCKKNKIDNFNKLNIILQEIRKTDEKSLIKYIDPIIIGTLFLAIWEIYIQDIYTNTNLGYTVSVGIVFSIGFSVLLGIVKRIILDNKDFFLTFDNYSNKKQLENLIVYRMLKCKK